MQKNKLCVGPTILCSFPRGNKVYEPPRYMDVGVAASQLMEGIETRKDESSQNALKCKSASYVIIIIL